MTQDEFDKNMDALISDCTERMRKNVKKIVSSGAIDIEPESNNYTFPKAVLLALLKEEIFQHEPFDGCSKRLKKKVKKRCEEHL